MATLAEADVHGSKREELLSGLLSAVKACQVRFGGRTELAVETDVRVATLCSLLEAGLSHGLKPRSPNRGLAAIKQVTGMVTSGLNLTLGLPGGDVETPVLWWYVRELLTRHEYERFLLLKHINTDIGRGRAWLRSLLSEHSLERYMHILVCDETLLKQWYEPWALLRDHERAAMLPNLAAGLDSILFAINIDNGELNAGCPSDCRPPPPTAKPEPEAQIAAATSLPSSNSNAAAARKKELRRKKKKIPAQLISFDEDLSRPDRPDVGSPLYHSAPTTCLSSPAPTTSGSATPYADRLEKLVHLQGLQQAKDALKPTHEKSQDPPPRPGCIMGNVSERLREESSPLEDLEQLEEGEEVRDTTSNHQCDQEFLQEASTRHYDDESLHSLGTSTNQHSYQQLFENLLTKPSPPEAAAVVVASADSRFTQQQQQQPHQRPNCLYDQETGSYKSNQSNLSADSLPSSEGEGGGGAAVFTPLGGGGEVGALFPVSPRGLATFDGLRSDDETSIHSYSQDVEEAAVAEARGTTSVSPTSVCTLPSSSSGGDTTLTMDELKAAILEISRARDSAEGRRVEVAAALKREMEVTSMLRAEIAHQHSLHQETLDKLNTRVNTLTRENELLKHQLKKYVGAVQLLRREGSCDGGSQLPPKTAPDYRDYHNEAAAYEAKLIQVAEMHGELMEFNERLHKLLRLREAQVRQLREELVELRGPLHHQGAAGEEDEDLDTGSSSSGSDQLTPDPANYSPSRPALINIWIPTAFLTGTSSDTHHVYQIYISIRDEEWNIYRRFAQFYELQQQLRKKDPIVKSFDFPQKKTFGYKDEGVVEERRVRLQRWLRKVVNLTLTSHPQLAQAPDKPSFTAALPFFSDTPQSQESSSSGGGSGGRIKSSRRGGVLSRFSNQQDQHHPPQYNGL